MPGPRVVVVGGGASGVLAAVHCAAAGCEVTVVEPGRLGRGIAYGTTDDRHLLNVSAGALSAFLDDPGHFARWAAADPSAYLPRRVYGDYLGALAAGTPGLRHVRAAATGVHPGGPVEVDAGDPLPADAVVLATGHGRSRSRTFPAAADPWDPAFLEALDDLDARRGAGDLHVVCIGTGLTFVDVALSVLGRLPGARVTGVSRHGLLPRGHEDAPGPPTGAGADPWTRRDEVPDRLRDLVHELRGRGDGWRPAVDALRPWTDQVWQGFEPREREQFREHVQRYWDVARHRMAPAVARTLAAHRDEGRLQVRRAGDDVRATVAGLRADRVVLCTGPFGDVTGTALGRQLLAAGAARRGPYGIGYDTAPGSGALLDAAGRADRRLLTLGPTRRGTLAESTAIPEIRQQAVALAAAVSTD